MGAQSAYLQGSRKCLGSVLKAGCRQCLERVQECLGDVSRRCPEGWQPAPRLVRVGRLLPRVPAPHRKDVGRAEHEGGAPQCADILRRLRVVHADGEEAAGCRRRLEIKTSANQAGTSGKRWVVRAGPRPVQGLGRERERCSFIR